MTRTTRARARTIAIAAALLAPLLITSPAAAQRFPPPNKPCWDRTVEIHGSQYADQITVTATTITVQRGKTTETIPLGKRTSLVIATYGGNDVVSIETDMDTFVCLGSGDNSMTADAGPGSADGDHDVESQGHLSVDLGNGDDLIVAEGSAGDLNAGDGFNVVIPFGEFDAIVTGGGFDVVALASGASGHRIATGRTGDVIGLEEGAAVNEIDSGAENDRVAIADGAAVGELITGDGNDRIDVTGFGAADIIRAGSGNDTIDAGNAHNTIYTGTGNDTLNAGSGFDRCYITSADDTAANCELTYQQ